MIVSQTSTKRYRGVRLLGHGGMATVELAHDTELDRPVAIKRLADNLAASDEYKQRFLREARLAARLSHPNIVGVYDAGAENGIPYIVMEYVEGETVSDLVRRRGRVGPVEAVALALQACSGLQTAHDAGLVHRDIKPQNLLITPDGTLKIADFGIARSLDGTRLTQAGTVLGTAGYLAPEQAAGGRSTPSSDLYSLAVVAYELLSGHRPFERESPTAEAAAHVNAPVPSIAERCKHLPYQVDAVFQRALAKDPRKRYGSAREFVADLRHALHEGAGSTARFSAAAPPQRREPGVRYLVPAALLLFAAGIGAALAVLLSTGGSKTEQSVITRTVTRPGGTTTVRQTVTKKTAAPASPPPPLPVSGGDGRALNDHGYTLMQQGNYAGALPYLQQAVQALRGSGPSDPYEGFANYNLGYTLYRLGQCQAAVQYLQRAQQLEPDCSEPRSVLGRAERC